jgi:hypothetical protein
MTALSDSRERRLARQGNVSSRESVFSFRERASIAGSEALTIESDAFAIGRLRSFLPERRFVSKPPLSGA